MRTEISTETRKVIVELRAKGKSYHEFVTIFGRDHTSVKKNRR